MPRLVTPDVRLRSSFLEAMAEFAAEGRGAVHDDSMVGADLRQRRELWEDADGFATYVRQLVAQSEEDAPRPPGFVPSTTLWWVDGEEFLGRIAIRHRLTEHLLEVGGLIGYDIRPSARRRGHATAMLAAALPVARELGIDPALITCDTDNVGSRRVIEANGGVLEDERNGKFRYWVPTA
jgi:predicted acetyltransferase